MRKGPSQLEEWGWPREVFPEKGIQILALHCGAHFCAHVPKVWPRILRVGSCPLVCLSILQMQGGTQEGDAGWSSPKGTRGGALLSRPHWGSQGASVFLCPAMNRVKCGVSTEMLNEDELYQF